MSEYYQIINAHSSFFFQKDPNQWKVIFYMTASIYVLASVIFVIFGSGELQPWNDEETDKGKEKFCCRAVIWETFNFVTNYVTVWGLINEFHYSFQSTSSVFYWSYKIRLLESSVTPPAIYALSHQVSDKLRLWNKKNWRNIFHKKVSNNKYWTRGTIVVV